MTTHRALDLAAAASKQWMDGFDQRSVASTVPLETLKQRLNVPLQDAGVPAEEVIAQLVDATKGGHLGSGSGRFFAWVIGGALPSAMAADWLTSSWDQNAGLTACGPAASVIEEIAGEWLKELLDLPREASFAFTTGCQLAHVTCLAAARAAVLHRAGWNVHEDGLVGAPPIRVLASDQRHSSVDRALRLLGLGTRCVDALPTNAQGQLTRETLETALARSAHSSAQPKSQPTIVVLNAGDLNIGSFDPFAELIPIAKAAGAWVHVDGAFGLFARASARKRHLTEGIELADSWATDGHKWLNVPFDCGVAIVRDRKAHREAMTVSASYLTPESRARDQIDWNPEFSRRARSIPVYAALRELGRHGLAELVDRCCQRCHELVTGLGNLPGAKRLNDPQLNQGLVRFLDPRTNATEADHAARTDAVIAAINATGEAFFSGSTWRGMRVMRVSVVNWRTNEEDVRRSVEAARRVLQSL